MAETDMDITHMDREEAIEFIMDKYGNDIKRMIYTYLKNEADTDDVTQEVFLLIYRKLYTYQGKSSLRSWIFSIAINESKDYLRSWKLRNRRLREKLMHTQRIEKEETDTPESKILKQRESDRLFHHVMGLQTKYREIIILYHFEELTTNEISNALSVKEATVRTRLARGRKKLRDCLMRDGGDFE